jgi:thiol-disulfide isomerase/thioredoxin
MQTARCGTAFLSCAILACLLTPGSAQTTCVPQARDYILHRVPGNAPDTRSTTTRAPWAPFVTPRNTSCAVATAAAAAAAAGVAADERLGPGNSSRSKLLLRRADDDAIARILRAAKHAREDTVVLFYGATWCPWSRAFWPVWAAAASRFHALCLVAVDAYNHPSLNANYGVYGFPTVLHFGAGNLMERYTGDRSEDDFVAWIVNVTRTAPAQPEDIPEEFAYDPWARALPEDTATDWVLAASTAVTVVAAAWAMYTMRHVLYISAGVPEAVGTGADGTQLHVRHGEAPITPPGGPVQEGTNGVFAETGNNTVDGHVPEHPVPNT